MIETELKPNKVTRRVANGSRHGGSYSPQPGHSSALCATGTSCSFVKFVSFPLGPPLINKSSFQLIRFSPQLVKKLDTTHGQHVLQNSKHFKPFQSVSKPFKPKKSYRFVRSPLHVTPSRGLAGLLVL